MAYTLTEFITNVKSGNAVKVRCKVSTAIYPIYIGNAEVQIRGTADYDLGCYHTAQTVLECYTLRQGISDNVLVADLGTIPLAIAGILTCEESLVSMDYQTAIAHGKFPSHQAWSKLGYNDDIGNSVEDLWMPGGVYVFPTSAMGMEVVSSSTNDTANGSGVQKVHIYYLTSDFTEKIEEVTLDGTNVVPTVAQDIYRVNRFFAHECGVNGTSAGTINLRHINDTPIYSQIVVGQTRSKKIIYTVPKGKILYISGVTVCAGAASAGRQVRFTTKATYCKEDAIRTTFFMDFTDIFAQDSTTAMILPIPTRFPEGVDIKVSAISPDGATKCACTLRGWIETI